MQKKTNQQQKNLRDSLGEKKLQALVLSALVYEDDEVLQKEIEYILSDPGDEKLQKIIQEYMDILRIRLQTKSLQDILEILQQQQEQRAKSILRQKIRSYQKQERGAEDQAGQKNLALIQGKLKRFFQEKSD